MRTTTATVVNAKIINAVHNLWWLTLTADDSVDVKKYRVRSRYPFRNGELRRFKVTLKDDKVIQIKPLE